MPSGKGTYGTKVGRPKKSLLSKAQNTLPDSLKKRVMALKKKKNA
tara:strand:+ start:17960 stop:18094 length:135 start_codon:yes stop_codon:yes gene_type:complete